MTKEQLESYRSMEEEIKELEYKLLHLEDGDSMIDNDVIMDYRSGYPVPQSIVGYDYARHVRLSDRYRKRILKLEKEIAEVEEFVEEIPDSVTRRIFRMYYIEGMTQRKIAEAIHIERSSVSKKIEVFLKSFTQFT